MVYLIPNYFKFFVKIESSAECSAREEVVSSKFCCILIRLLNDDSLSGAELPCSTEQFTNKSAINATYISAVLHSTSGNRARKSTLSQLAANHLSSIFRRRSNHRYHCRDAIVFRVSTSVGHKQRVIKY